MSVLVTTTFSQGAVFYAGETLACTIAFTNPLPLLPPPPAPKVSTSTPSTSSSVPNRPPARLRSPPLRAALSTHARSQSLHTTEREPSERLATIKSRSLTSLATSTLAYFTGSSATEAPPEERGTQWEATGKPCADVSLNGAPTAPTEEEEEEEVRLRDDPSAGAIPIELDSQGANSPSSRSSIDTIVLPTSQEPGTTDLSRRSSLDSLATQPFSTPALPGLSRLLKPPSSAALLKKPERLMWGFAQVVGHFIVEPTLINNNEFAPLKHRTMYQPQGVGIGGGGGGLLAAKPDAHTKIDTRTTPVFSTPPSILFVDLDLAPGETKKFSYKLKLPHDIPPSHRGKSIRFNYYLVVGTQRTPTTNTAWPAQSGANQGQVVQIRFRVLNHVSEDGSRPIYDLMNPVVLYKDEALVQPYSSEGSKRTSQSMNKRTPSEKNANRQAFMSYVDELLLRSQENDAVHEFTRRESDAYDEEEAASQGQEGEIDEEPPAEHAYRHTCAKVVSRITNNSRKAMYDICKNNQRVAKLHLIKVAHRLGEPVLGVLDFEGAALSTYRVSIFLESKEMVEPSIALRQPQHIARVSRKCHSEFHSYCLGNQRLSFSLPIPPTASPEFQTTGVKLLYSLKFEFITSCFSAEMTTPPPSYLAISTDERHAHFQSMQDVSVSTFDCQIPIRVYGSPGGADRTLFGRPFTFTVQ